MTADAELYMPDKSPLASAPPAVALYATSEGISRPLTALGQCAEQAQLRRWAVSSREEFWDCAPVGRQRLDARVQWGRVLQQAEIGMVQGVVVHRLADVVPDAEAYVRLAGWAADNRVFLLFVDGGSYGPLHLVGRAPAVSPVVSA
ncbi:hypothetical protein ABZW10_38345 [Kitasatospora sp. NPDC004723]|uniref:hypothetical protein n=1 Tax=Kitasatospora sp. NPDC004723 TaxID=3154288 RepID=UPI0033B47DC1